MATLQLSLRDPNRGIIHVSSHGLNIGRDPQNDLVLQGQSVSRRHAVVVHAQGQLAIHDEHSTNGTFVNNARVHGTVGLRVGDAIRIGSYTLFVEAQAAASIPPPATRLRPIRRVAVRRVNALVVIFSIVTLLLVGFATRAALPGAGDRFVLPTPVAVVGPDQARTLASSAPPTPIASTPSLADLVQQTAPNVVVIANQAANESGTGFFIDGNHVVTNAHVVKGANDVKLTVLAPSGGGQPITRSAHVLARDETMDLAVLTVAQRVASYLSLRGAQGLRVGDPVITVGEPHGLAGTATYGHVSALRTGAEFDLASTLTVVQFDAAINPGNSGGPLVTDDGKVVGIVTFGMRNAQGLGFAIGGDALWARAREWIAREQPAVR